LSFRSKFYGATVAATKLPRRIFRGHGLVADDSGIAPEPESPYSEAVRELLLLL